MGTIAQQITRLETAKADIKTALEGLGQTVPDSATIDQYTPYIQDISGGSWLPSAQTILETFSRKVSEHRCPATIEKIYGRTIIWNQLVTAANFESTTETDVTFTKLNDYQIQVTTESTVSATRSITIVSPQSTISGHKYYMSACPTGIKSGDYWGIVATNNIINNTSSPIIVTGNGQSGPIKIRIGNAYTTPLVFTFVFIDLTLMFGAGNEPITVDEFESFYSLPYYSYDPGTLKSLAPEALKSTGFNQWDEEWEPGYFYDSNGTLVYSESSGTIRSANLIPVITEKKYYFYCDNDEAIIYMIATFDVNGDYLGCVEVNADSYGYFYIPTSGVAYIKFFINYYGDVYNYDTCVNMSSAKNDQYEPYRYCRAGLPVLKYFPYGMKSAGTAYDELTPKKAIKRIGIVDLGSLEWEYDSVYARFVSSQLSDIKAYDTARQGEVICSKYTCISDERPLTDVPDKSCYVGAHQDIVVHDSAYSDANTFTTAMDGVYLVYELATPVETDINEDMTFLADEGGTQEVTPITAPFKADIRYAKDIG